MELSTKEVLESLGLPADLDSKEKIVEAHRKNYLLKSEAHEDEDVKGKITGKLLGELTTKAKKLFGFSNEEIKDKHFKDILSEGVERFSLKIGELEESAGKGSEEVIKKAKEDAERFRIQASQYKEDLNKVLGEKTELEASFTGKLKQFKVENIYKDALSKVPFSETVNEVSKLGFNTLVQSKYKIDLDENEAVVVLDSKGQKIPNPTKTGVYLGLNEVLELEAKAANMLKQNNLPGSKPAAPTYTSPAAPPAAPTRQISQRAIDNAEKHKASA